MSHAPARHIRRCNHSQPCDLDGYTLLSFRADNAASDVLEWACGDNHLVATLEVALLGRDKKNVGVIDVAEADEIVHLAVGDGERRIFAVCLHGEVVVIVAEAGVARVVDGLVEGRERGMGKDDVGYQRIGDFLSFAVNYFDLVAQWEEDLDAFAFEPFARFPLTIVRDTEGMPAGSSVEAISYRYPSNGLAGDGAQWWLSTYGRVVALPVVHINQRVRV